MKTSIQKKPVWSTEQIRSIEVAIAVLNKHKSFAEEIRELIAREKEKGVHLELSREEIDAMMDVYIPSTEDLDYEEMRNHRLRDDERI